MKAECYTLDLYCDNSHPFGSFPDQFIGRTQGECYKKARKRGWKIGKTNDICPLCNKASKGIKKPPTDEDR